MNISLYEYDPSISKAVKKSREVNYEKKFQLISTLNDTRHDALELQAKLESYLFECSDKLRALKQSDPDLLKYYMIEASKRFRKGADSVDLIVDGTVRVNVRLDRIKQIMEPYAEQAHKIIHVTLEENELDLEKNVVRLDYTCRGFSHVFGMLLKEMNPESKDKFHCIDNYDFLVRRNFILY
jgi:hypothetical protein